MRLSTQGVDACCDIHLHISPWQEGVVFDGVHFFVDSLLPHEEYLHSHKWRAVNKLACAEPQSHQTPFFFLSPEKAEFRRHDNASSLFYNKWSHGSITFNVVNKRNPSLAYLWLAQLASCLNLLQSPVCFNKTTSCCVVESFPISVPVAAREVSAACQMMNSTCLKTEQGELNVGGRVHQTSLVMICKWTKWAFWHLQTVVVKVRLKEFLTLCNSFEHGCRITMLLLVPISTEVR